MSDWIDGITAGEPNNTDAWVRMGSQYAHVGSSWKLVTDRFDKTSAFAEQAFSLSKGYQEALEGILHNTNEYKTPEIIVAFPEILYPEIELPETLKERKLFPIKWPIENVLKPELNSLPEIQGVHVPSGGLVPPVYIDPVVPEIGEHSPPEKPFISGPPIPEAPDFIVPPVPVIQDFTVPSIPSLEIGDFDGVLRSIEEDLVTPEGFDWKSSTYNSEIWDTFLSKVLYNLRNGGTGLAPDIEQAIFDRAKYRLQIERDNLLVQAENYFSSKGFNLPPGAVAQRVLMASVEMFRADNDLNEKIAIEQAELAQKNEHFILELALKAEMVLREFFNFCENRLLEAAKTTVLMGIEILRSHISRQQLYLEVYKAELLVFTERVKVVLAKVDIYKAQIEAVKVASDVQRARVELYTAQIGALETLARMYSARLQGAKIQQEIEQLKIEVFKAETEAYSVALSAEKNKIEIYTAQIEAEKTKAITFGEKVKARQGEIEAKRIELEIQVATLNASVQKNNAELDRYKSELSAYGIKVDSKAKEVGANVEAYKAEVSAYLASVSSQDSYFSMKTKEADLRLQEARIKLEKQIAEIKAQSEAFLAIKRLQVEGTSGVMNVSSQLTASALTAVHASANFGYSGSESLGHQFSYGANISESHSIPHDPPQ